MSAPGAVYTVAAANADTDVTLRPLRQCADCGAALDTSLASNVRVCARDRVRRRALTFLRQADRILRESPQLPAFTAAREHTLEAIEELHR